jgi:hypothetical protein
LLLPLLLLLRVVILHMDLLLGVAVEGLLGLLWLLLLLLLLQGKLCWPVRLLQLWHWPQQRLLCEVIDGLAPATLQP